MDMLESQPKRRDRVATPVRYKDALVTSDQQQFLTLLGSGYSYGIAEERVNQSPEEARSNIGVTRPDSISSKLGTLDKVETVIKGLALNIVDIEDMAKEKGMTLRQFIGKYSLLTPAERVVMHLMTFNGGKGTTNMFIAQELGVSNHTANNHIINILDKTGFTDRVQIAVLGVAVRSIRAVMNINDNLPDPELQKNKSEIAYYLAVEEEREVAIKSGKSKPILTPHQQDVLNLVSKGIPYEQVGKMVDLLETSVARELSIYHRGTIGKKFQARGKTSATVTGLLLNKLDPEKCLSEAKYDFHETIKRYTTLSSLQKTIIHAFTYNLGQDSTSQQIALKLGLGESTVKKHLDSSMKILGFEDRVQVGVLGTIVRDIRTVMELQNNE